TETQAAQLSEFIGQARLSVAEMGDRALKGGETLRQLIAEAADQFRELAEAAKAERDEFGQSTLHSLEAVSDAAAQERAKLEAQTRAAIEALAEAADKTRAAAERHAETARDQVDQLSEAAFSAGQKANAVFETRLAEARELIEQSAHLVEQAGAATARKLDEGAATARATLDELAGLLSEIEVRAARLPIAARGQAEEVRLAVTESIDELMDHARRTAEETQAIDAAFQERVRRNYDMLSEAVRLMGVSATLPPAPLAASAPLAAPEPRAARPRPVAKAEAPPPSPPPAPVIDDEVDLALEELMEPAPVRLPAAAPAELPEDPGLRPRLKLKLTPTATDEEFSAVFDGAGGIGAEPSEPAHEGESWTWKDLLASIDGADADGERLQDILGDELAAMGVEPAKLLPKARIDEIAAAVQVGDIDGAREVVKRLAPAATRRISRRLVTDEAIRRQVQVYVRRYQTLVDDAVVRDPEGFLMASLLGDDAGRIYLLLDAAAGDIV
ncbi:MAG: polar localization protein TipN, partial [Phenylobacterium sp.]